MANKYENGVNKYGESIMWRRISAWPGGFALAVGGIAEREMSRYGGGGRRIGCGGGSMKK